MMDKILRRPPRNEAGDHAIDFGQHHRLAFRLDVEVLQPEQQRIGPVKRLPTRLKKQVAQVGQISAGGITNDQINHG